MYLKKVTLAMYKRSDLAKNEKKLLKLRLPPLKEPIDLKILWLRILTSDSDNREIVKYKHKHSFFEAHLVISGTIEYSSLGENYKLDSGAIILFPPECIHSVVDKASDFLKISVAFTSKSDLFSRGLPSRSEIISPGYVFEEMLELIKNKPPYFSYMLRDKVFYLLKDHICKSRIPIDTNQEAEDVRISLAKQYIDDNTSIFLTCEDVAKYCHFNPKYLGRIFKEATGVTLLDYIHARKTDEAEKLLSSTELSLLEISERLGFENEYYFNAFFKRRTGLPPGLYRRLRK